MDKLRKAWGQNDKPRKRGKFLRFRTRSNSSKKRALLMKNVPTIYVTAPGSHQHLDSEGDQLNARVEAQDKDDPNCNINNPATSATNPADSTTPAYSTTNPTDNAIDPVDYPIDRIKDATTTARVNTVNPTGNTEKHDSCINSSNNPHTDNDTILQIHEGSDDKKTYNQVCSTKQRRYNALTKNSKGDVSIDINICSSSPKESALESRCVATPTEDDSKYVTKDRYNQAEVESKRYVLEQGSHVEHKYFPANETTNEESNGNKYSPNSSKSRYRVTDSSSKYSGVSESNHDEDPPGLCTMELVPPSAEVQDGDTLPAQPDEWWKWLVLAGTIYIAMSVTSIGSCFGILFRDIMTNMGVSTTVVSGILSVHMFLWNSCAILAGPLCKHLDWRAVGCTCSLIFSIAFISMSQAVTPIFIFFAFSIVIGSLGGIATVMCFIVIPNYFKERKGMASSMFLAGIALGQIIFPLVIRYLQDEFGFSGATIIHGGILLNCCAASALFRPIRSRKQSWKNTSLLKSNRARSAEASGWLLGTKDVPNTSKTRSEDENTSCFVVFQFICSDIARTVVKDMKEVKNLKMALVTLSVAFLVLGFINFISLVPFVVRSEGYSAQEASFCVSIAGVGNTLTRIIMAFIADKKWMNYKLVYICGCFLACGGSLMFSLVTSSLPMMWVSLVGWGVGIGTSNSIYVVLLFHVVGVEKYESAISITCLMLAFVSLAIGPLIGLVGDLASSYIWSLYACAGVKLCAALLCLLTTCGAGNRS